MLPSILSLVFFFIILKAFFSSPYFFDVNLTKEELQIMHDNNRLDVAIYEKALKDLKLKLAAQPQSFYDELVVFQQMRRGTLTYLSSSLLSLLLLTCSSSFSLTSYLFFLTFSITKLISQNCKTNANKRIYPQRAPFLLMDMELKEKLLNLARSYIILI
jgi:hypothetical protein